MGCGLKRTKDDIGNKWIWVKMEHSGNITMYVTMVIPFLLYFSKSIIKKPEQCKGGTALYSIHLTPFFSFSFAWRIS